MQYFTLTTDTCPHEDVFDASFHVMTELTNSEFGRKFFKRKCQVLALILYSPDYLDNGF
jgi:hypothetical protein